MSVKLLMNNIADSKIWIGWIPQDLEGTGIGITREEEMAEEFNEEVMNFGIANGSLVEMDSQVLDKYSLGIVPEGGYCCVVAPKGYAVTFDNGFGGKITLTEAIGVNGDFIQDGMPLKELIDGVQYYLFGIMFNTYGEFFFYVDTI
jgi:hypothetical protein